MIVHASQLAIPQGLIRRRDTALDQAPLLQRVEAARWAIAGLGGNPQKLLSHAVLSPVEATGRPPCYAD